MIGPECFLREPCPYTLSQARMQYVLQCVLQRVLQHALQCALQCVLQCVLQFAPCDIVDMALALQKSGGGEDCGAVRVAVCVAE